MTTCYVKPVITADFSFGLHESKTPTFPSGREAAAGGTVDRIGKAMETTDLACSQATVTQRFSRIYFVHPYIMEFRMEPPSPHPTLGTKSHKFAPFLQTFYIIKQIPTCSPGGEVQKSSSSF